MFSIDGGELDNFQNLEQACQDKMDPAPGLGPLWASSAKPEGLHSARLKAKVMLPGTHFFNVSGERTDPPETRRRLKVNAALKIKSICQPKQCTGLMIEVLAFQYGPQGAVESAVTCPFRILCQLASACISVRRTDLSPFILCGNKPSDNRRQRRNIVTCKASGLGFGGMVCQATTISGSGGCNFSGW